MADNAIGNESYEFNDQLAAAKLILDCDAKNLAAVKMVIPHKVETINIKQASTEELREAITEALKLMPTLEGEFTDGN